MRRKLLLLSCCMVLCLSVVACDKSSKNTNDKNTHITTAENESGSNTTDDSAYPTQSVVVMDENSKDETLKSDTITVSVTDIDGFYRSYGTSSIIEYLSDSEQNEGFIDFMIYAGNSIEGVVNSRNVYVDDSAYGNVLKGSEDTSLDVNGVSYTVVSYTYTHNDRTVHEALILTAPTENTVVAVLYTQYDDNVLNEEDMTKAIHSMSVSTTSKKEDESSDESSDTSSEDSSESNSSEEEKDADK